MGLRRALRLLLAVGTAGTLVELVLLEHTDGAWQKLPLALLAAGLLALTAEGLGLARRATPVVDLLMTLFILAGLVGLYQHYSGNVEFERELNAARHGWDLTWRALKGATPALAPAAMIFLGMIGLLGSRTPRDAATTRPGGRSGRGIESPR